MNAIAKDIYEAAVYGDVEIVKRLLKSATFADLIYKNPNDVKFEHSFHHRRNPYSISTLSNSFIRRR